MLPLEKSLLIQKRPGLRYKECLIRITSSEHTLDGNEGLTQDSICADGVLPRS